MRWLCRGNPGCTMRSSTKLLIVAVNVLACVETNAQENAAKRVTEWPGVPYSRVVGYSFVPDSKDDEFTLLRDGKFNEAKLKEVKTKEAVLAANQTKNLLKATFDYSRRTQGAACYEPHHIFVFYDSASHPIGAIEICFSCRHIGSWPVPAKQVNGHDFAALAKLSWKLGLGLGSPKVSLDWYLDLLKSFEIR